MNGDALAPDTPVLVLCTAPDDDAGASLARALVDARVAACVNVIGGVRSFYRWKGEVQADPEVQLLIKTRAARLEELEAFIDAHHPYEVPELLVLRVDAGSGAYLGWLRAQTE